MGGWLAARATNLSAGVYGASVNRRTGRNAAVTKRKNRQKSIAGLARRGQIVRVYTPEDKDRKQAGRFVGEPSRRRARPDWPHHQLVRSWGTLFAIGQTG